MKRDPSLQGLNDCGCCEGRSIKTPAVVYNRPGLGAIGYRVGTYHDFKDTMLTSISSRPELQKPTAKLTTRDDDDPSIAVLDTWAMVADILTFYQERIANESYLRTATERRSVLELARTIGYEPNPGVAASAYLAFDLEDAPGSPERVIIDKGLKVQSTPGQDEMPQVFETIEQIEARAEWNAMKPRQTKMMLPGPDPNVLYLKGLNTNLRKGDVLFAVADPEESNWQVLTVADLVLEPEFGRTKIQLVSGLSFSLTPDKGVKVYAMRTKAYLINGSPPPRTPPPPFCENLDAVYGQVVAGSWAIFRGYLSSPAIEGTIALKAPKIMAYKINQVLETDVDKSGITIKSTQICLSKNEDLKFNPKNTTIYAQSEELELAETPLEDPIYGTEIAFEKPVKGLKPGQKIIISGKRIRARVIGKEPLTLISLNDPAKTRKIQPGEELIILKPPANQGSTEIWHLMDMEGFEGRWDFESNMIRYVPARKEDPVVSELLEIAAVESEDKVYTKLKLSTALENIYDRTTAKISANVALATHGESTLEVLGSGDARIAHQSFTLNQSPLTYVSAPTPEGLESTLEIRVNDLLWHEVPILYGRSTEERVYTIRNGDDDRATVQFGSRLPTGQENVRARYRKGLGSEGILKAGQINILLTRPLGVRGAVNPMPSEGGTDRQPLEAARKSAPLAVMTLDRVVSLKDYEDFARAFAGVSKAMATWTWNGERQGVLVTVAGPGGIEVGPNNPVIQNLPQSMQRFGDPRVPLRVVSYSRAPFVIRARLKIASDEIQEKVISVASTRLKEHFSFDAREFGEHVALSEVMTVLQNVQGVEAVNVEALHRAGEAEDLLNIIEAKVPLPGGQGETASGAELLVLERADLGVML
jgi:hypothetical protein